jgi:nucleotide-binding universal stress UspA family protein
MNGPLLVATDGTPGSAGALRMARALARRDGLSVAVLAVLPPTTLTPGAVTYPLLPGESQLQEMQLGLLRSAVEELLHAVCGAECGWQVEIEIGSPQVTIVRRAAELGASMIVMGLGRHSAADRWLGTETVLKVTQLAHLPVLAVHKDAQALPQRCIVAVDFSGYSRDAARSASQLLGSGTELHLAHVARTTPGSETGEGREWQETYRAGARTRLDAVRGELVSRSTSAVFTALLEGETSRALLRYATMTGAHLLACGSHGYGFFTRMTAGNVATRLIRGANCSVLVVPPPTVVGELVNGAAGATASHAAAATTG